jgi:hypothetical protein
MDYEKRTVNYDDNKNCGDGNWSVFKLDNRSANRTLPKCHRSWVYSRFYVIFSLLYCGYIDCNGYFCKKETPQNDFKIILRTLLLTNCVFKKPIGLVSGWHDHEFPNSIHHQTGVFSFCFSIFFSARFKVDEMIKSGVKTSIMLSLYLWSAVS